MRQLNTKIQIEVLVLFILLAGCSGCGEVDAESTCEVEVSGPVGIIIGASVAEGHPALHGLHHGQCNNKPGQISYYLEEWTGIQVLNQGIGGQTCKEILERWNTDVDAYEPEFVWLNCGQNDYLNGGNNTTILQSTLKAVQKAQVGGYQLYIQNLGYNFSRPDLNDDIDAINTWYLTLAGPTVAIVDYYSWEINHTNLLGDGLHPTMAGYESFMNYVKISGDIK